MTGISVLPQQLQQRLRDELKPGEALAWVGQPNPTRYMQVGFKMWFFFIPWTAFSIYWMAGAMQFRWPSFEGEWGYFPFFGLPFVLIGIGGMCLPFWLRRNAASVIYAISNQRALSIEGSGSITVKSYLPGDIANIEKKLHKDGSGDLILRIEHYRDSEGDQRANAQGFFSIADVRGVERLIEKLIRPASAF